MTMHSEHRGYRTDSVVEQLGLVTIVVVGMAGFAVWLYLLWELIHAVRPRARSPETKAVATSTASTTTQKWNGCNQLPPPLTQQPTPPRRSTKPPKAIKPSKIRDVNFIANR